jgi:hypothetical protein
MAEGAGFEPPRASRPGGFQVPETMGTIGRNRTPLAAISGPGRSSSSGCDHCVPMVADGSSTVLTQLSETKPTRRQRNTEQLPKPEEREPCTGGAAHLTLPRRHAIVSGPEPRPARGECARNAPGASRRPPQTLTSAQSAGRSSLSSARPAARRMRRHTSSARSADRGSGLTRVLVSHEECSRPRSPIRRSTSPRRS